MARQLYVDVRPRHIAQEFQSILQRYVGKFHFRST